MILSCTLQRLNDPVHLPFTENKLHSCTIFHVFLMIGLSFNIALHHHIHRPNQFVHTYSHSYNHLYICVHTIILFDIYDIRCKRIAVCFIRSQMYVPVCVWIQICKGVCLGIPFLFFLSFFLSIYFCSHCFSHFTSCFSVSFSSSNNLLFTHFTFSFFFFFGLSIYRCGRKNRKQFLLFMCL